MIPRTVFLCFVVVVVAAASTLWRGPSVVLSPFRPSRELSMGKRGGTNSKGNAGKATRGGRGMGARNRAGNRGENREGTRGGGNKRNRPVAGAGGGYYARFDDAGGSEKSRSSNHHHGYQYIGVSGSDTSKGHGWYDYRSKSSKGSKGSKGYHGKGSKGYGSKGYGSARVGYDRHYRGSSGSNESIEAGPNYAYHGTQGSTGYYGNGSKGHGLGRGDYDRYYGRTGGSSSFRSPYAYDYYASKGSGDLVAPPHAGATGGFSPGGYASGASSISRTSGRYGSSSSNGYGWYGRKGSKSYHGTGSKGHDGNGTKGSYHSKGSKGNYGKGGKSSSKGSGYYLGFRYSTSGSFSSKGNDYVSSRTKNRVGDPGTLMDEPTPSISVPATVTEAVSVKSLATSTTEEEVRTEEKIGALVGKEQGSAVGEQVTNIRPEVEGEPLVNTRAFDDGTDSSKDYLDSAVAKATYYNDIGQVQDEISDHDNNNKFTHNAAYALASGVISFLVVFRIMKSKDVHHDDKDNPLTGAMDYTNELDSA